MQTFPASALFLSTLLLPALAAAASTTSSSPTATHTVQVGASGLSYTPDTVTAAKGDILEFHFSGGKEHDVVQGAFSSPCSDSNGIYSGYPSQSDVFQVTVNSTDPMWLYCSTSGHCQGGMAMVVNQASSGANTLDAYKSAAQGTSSSNAPANVQGGSVIAVSALSQSSSSSSSASSSGSASATGSAPASSSSSGAAETISSTFKTVALVIGIPVLGWLMD